MAEVEYMVKTTDLMRTAGERNEHDVLIDRMKIEDEVFYKFNVEMEHILITKREEKQQQPDLNTSEANLDTTADSIPFESIELEQPEEFIDWNTQKKENWFRTTFEKLLPVN